MNCQTINHYLLQTEDLDAPPAQVAEHVAHCLSCREYQRRLLLMERNVSLLPIPEITGRAALLLKLQEAEAPAQRGESNDQGRTAGRQDKVAGAVARKSFSIRWERLARKPVAAGVAAGILLLVFSWAVLRGPQGRNPENGSPRKDPFLAQLMKRDLALAEARNARASVETLSELAADLHSETRALVGTADSADLIPLVELYKFVIQEGVVKQVQALPDAERRQVADPIGDRLMRSGKQAEALAERVPGKAGPLRLLAAASRDGNDLLPRTAVFVSNPVDDASSPASEEWRVPQYRRNLGLVKQLVKSCILMSAEADSLHRADLCKSLAKSLAEEIGQAFKDNEAARAAEMGEHLRGLLRYAVADNLTTARPMIPEGTSRSGEFQKIQDWVVELTNGLEKELREAGIGDDDMQSTLQALADARADVKKAAQPTEP